MTHKHYLEITSEGITTLSSNIDIGFVMKYKCVLALCKYEEYIRNASLQIVGVEI